MKKILFAALIAASFTSCGLLGGDKTTGNDVTPNYRDDSIRNGWLKVDSATMQYVPDPAKIEADKKNGIAIP